MKTNWSEFWGWWLERVSGKRWAFARTSQQSVLVLHRFARCRLRDHRVTTRFASGNTSLRIQIADGAWNVFRVCGGAAQSCSPPDFQSKWQDVAFKMELPVSWKWCGWRSNNILFFWVGGELTETLPGLVLKQQEITFDYRSPPPHLLLWQWKQPQWWNCSKQPFGEIFSLLWCVSWMNHSIWSWFVPMWITLDSWVRLCKLTNTSGKHTHCSRAAGERKWSAIMWNNKFKK